MLSRYFYVFEVYLKNVLAYRIEMALDAIFVMVSSLVMVFVWFAVYLFSGVTSIEGVTFSSMVIYLFVIGSIGVLLFPGVAESMSEDMSSGEIATSLIRPIKYSFAVFIKEMPADMLFGLFGTAPILVLLYLFDGIPLGVFAAIAVVIEIVIAWFIINMVGFIIGSLAIYLTDIYGILNGITWSFTLLGGGIMPILLYPKIAYSVLMLTPFPFLYYVPAGTFTGMISVSALPMLIAEGLAWIGILAFISFFMWKRVSRDVNAVGV